MKPCSASSAAPERRRVSPATKLLTGITATWLLAYAAYFLQRQSLLVNLGSKAATIMAANGVTDGAARWTSDSDRADRIARLSGSADAATRARIRAQLAALPGIHDAIWTNPAR